LLDTLAAKISISRNSIAAVMELAAHLDNPAARIFCA